MPKLILSNEELNNIIQDYTSNISMRELIKKYHHDRNTLKRILQENGIILRNRTTALKCSPKKQEADILKRKYKINDNYFAIQNDKMAYMLGFLMADGNVSKTENLIQINLSEMDSDFLNMF